MNDNFDVTPSAENDGDGANIKPRILSRYERARFQVNNAPKQLLDSGCDPELWPTRYQYKRWFKYVIKSLPPDPDGAWYAVCPVKNKFIPAGNTRKPTAIIDFPAGIFRCLHEDPCHGKHRSMSIGNMDMRLLDALADGTMAKTILEEMEQQKKQKKTDDS